MQQWSFYYGLRVVFVSNYSEPASIQVWQVPNSNGIWRTEFIEFGFQENEWPGISNFFLENIWNWKGSFFPRTKILRIPNSYSTLNLVTPQQVRPCAVRQKAICSRRLSKLGYSITSGTNQSKPSKRCALPSAWREHRRSELLCWSRPRPNLVGN